MNNDNISKPTLGKCQVALRYWLWRSAGRDANWEGKYSGNFRGNCPWA